MDFDYKIAVVEDDRTTRLLLQSSLGSHYALHVVESAEELLALPDRGGAQLFLLDVGLPGMDGLELCRALKSDPATAQAPVMFLSGHDTSEEILAGYEAGGQDYIVKPFDVASLRHKIENLQRIQAQQEILAEQVRNADELTTQVLASLDEYAVLIKFLRTLNECETPDDLIQASLGALQGFNLEGAVQIRMQGSEKKCSAYGENWPLEVAVINHIRTLDRIFEHKHLAAFNFDNITMLVTNMPRHEFELCGRIRDHLAIAMESANAKIRAMQSFMENSWMRGEIGQIFDPQPDGSIITKYAGGENHIAVPGYEATIVPQKEGESLSYIERTRLKGYPELMKEAIQYQIRTDLIDVNYQGLTGTSLLKRPTKDWCQTSN